MTAPKTLSGAKLVAKFRKMFWKTVKRQRRGWRCRYGAGIGKWQERGQYSEDLFEAEDLPPPQSLEGNIILMVLHHNNQFMPLYAAPVIPGPGPFKNRGNANAGVSQC